MNALKGKMHGRGTAAGLTNSVDTAAVEIRVSQTIGRHNLACIVVEYPEGHGQPRAEAYFRKKNDGFVGRVEFLAFHRLRAIQREDDQRVEARVDLAALPDFVAKAGIRLGLHRRPHIDAIALALTLERFLAGGGLQNANQILGQGINEA